MKMRYLFGAAACVLLAGCTVGPNYKRPAIAVPDQFRGAAPVASAESVGDMKWVGLFQDEPLQQLVATALEQNFDLAIATQRIEEARAQYGITRADQYPNVSLQGTFAAQRQSSIGSFRFIPAGTDLSASYTQAGAAISWDLDLFGRLRRLSEAARARYLASEEARAGVVVSLVGDVMANYFVLRERDLELEIANQTRDVAQDSLRLVELRHDRGAATGLDVHQAEQFLYTATAQIASAKRDIEQAENALSLLAGRVPGEIRRGKPLEAFRVPADPPAGLPSDLLQRRPDIRAAEQNLVAANAEIGAARALYFPQISLTSFLGGQSRALYSLLTGPARFWTVAPAAVVPIFNAGQIRAGVRLSEAQQRELVATYQRSIYTAFREVSDALVGYQRTREQQAQQEKLVNALSESTRLSRLRYQGGLDSYLQVLDSERNLFQGQLTLAGLRLNVLTSFVQLYRALGGGWQA
jgi:NodT family efflux transporter outer membrane factor (OMF) lipoprotein